MVAPSGGVCCYTRSVCIVLAGGPLLCRRINIMYHVSGHDQKRLPTDQTESRAGGGDDDGKPAAFARFFCQVKMLGKDKGFNRVSWLSQGQRVRTTPSLFYFLIKILSLRRRAQGTGRVPMTRLSPQRLNLAPDGGGMYWPGSRSEEGAVERERAGGFRNLQDSNHKVGRSFTT